MSMMLKFKFEAIADDVVRCTGGGNNKKYQLFDSRRNGKFCHFFVHLRWINSEMAKIDCGNETSEYKT